LDFCKVM